MTDKLDVHFADGSVISEWQEFSLTENYTEPLGSLTLTAMPAPERASLYLDKLKRGERIEASINGVPQASYIITSRVVRVGNNVGTVIQATAKSPLVTLYEGAVVPPNLQVKSGNDAPIVDTLKKIVEPYGFKDITTDVPTHRKSVTGKPIANQAGKLVIDKLKHGEAKAQEGEKAYAMIARLIRSLGVCMRLSVDGKLMLCAPDYTQDPSYVLCQDSTGAHSGDRFFGDIELEESNDDQYSHCIVRGTPIKKKGTRKSTQPYGAIRCVKSTPFLQGLEKAHFPTASFSDTQFKNYQSSAAPFKPMFLNSKSTRDIAQCTNLATFTLGRKAERAYCISGRVNGFVSQLTGAVYNVDTVADVFIEALGVYQLMWVIERRFAQSVSDGQFTELKLIPLGALVLGEAPE